METEKRECENCDELVTRGKDGFYLCGIHRDERGFND